MKGWATDPRTGHPIYVERNLDPQLYQVREVSGPEGPQLEISGPDLIMRLPKPPAGILGSGGTLPLP